MSDELLNAAKANDHAAIDMIAIWGDGYRATLGGSETPGLWMLGGAERLLERAASRRAVCRSVGLQRLSGRARCGREGDGSVDRHPGQPGPDDAGQGRQGGCRRHSGCRVTVLEGAGHMLMSERPDEVLAALRS